MKDGHFHFVETAIVGALSTIVIIHVIRLAVAPLAARDDQLGVIGKAIGALVTF